MRHHLRTPQRRSALEPDSCPSGVMSGRSARRPRVGWRQLAFAISFSAVAASACSGADVGPEQVIRSYADAYNANDVDGLTELFAEDALMTGHPFGAHADGIDTILNVHAADRAIAAVETPYEISNIEVTGNTVSWDHVWTNRDGSDYCAEGHSAVVEGGKIVLWEFAPNPYLCT